MILQDLAGILLSSLSFFASDFFRLAWRNYRQLQSTKENSSRSNSITRSLKSVIHERKHDYGTIPSQDTLPRSSIYKSFLNSVYTSVTMLIAALPLGSFATLLLFVQMNTVNLCSEWIEYRGLGVETDVMRWKLIGDIINVGLSLWFPSTMVFLFGWKEFKTHHFTTLLVCFIAACLDIIYKLILFIFNDHVEKEFFYHIAGNICFFASILLSSYLIAVKVRKNGEFYVPPPKILIMATISAQFVFAFIIGQTGKYFIIPTFNELDSQYMKAIFAAITPVVIIIPIAVCRQFALLSNVFSNTKNHFILAYFVYGATIIVYRVMQADVKNQWLFIGLSVLHGLVNIVGKATEKLRYKLWTRIFRALKRCRCCRRMELQVHGSLYHQRLTADKEIQTMLYDYAAMILSQMYVTLYLVTNFDNSSANVFHKSLKRIAIGLGIDFFFNTFSIFVRDYVYNSPVQKVWKEHWKVHLKANAVTTAMTIWWYFSSGVLITVIRVRIDGTSYILRNCTAPVHY